MCAEPLTLVTLVVLSFGYAVLQRSSYPVASIFSIKRGFRRTFGPNYVFQLFLHLDVADEGRSFSCGARGIRTLSHSSE